MDDLNSLYYFSNIVEYGSLSAASQALGVAKSVLSQHLSKLETTLGVRLIQRTTRSLQVTEVGMRYYERCRAVFAEVERARGVIDDVREVPRGRVRMGCPMNFAQAFLAPVLASFMAEYHEVDVVLECGNRELDMIAGGYDLMLRIVPSIKKSSVVARSFSLRRHVLVASRELVRRIGVPQRPEDLKRFPCLGGAVPVERDGQFVWQLSTADGAKHDVTFHPRLWCEDLVMLKEAALLGVGVADLPPGSCADEIADGRFVRLLPQWELPELKLHAVYPSRKGLTLAVRTLIDYIADRLPPALDSIMREDAFVRNRLAAAVAAG